VFRQRLVIYIFRKLDRNSSGYIEESELAKYYKSSNLAGISYGLSVHIYTYKCIYIYSMYIVYYWCLYLFMYVYMSIYAYGYIEESERTKY
jgi:hypothetical protein